ncbi:hypothetical protein [Sphingomonas sp. GC_Shp_3]|uniref:hypothetical protein n=2 Tax=unclassified Sphingomonas TaxID=196159 RepID=UPI00226A08EB|nr:hypothetical protein [Sphingomonas sp. GC_Shp_3]
MTKHPEQLPADATAERGEVMIDGPDGYVLSLTPEAALHTARSLRAAAREAEQQRSELSHSVETDQIEGVSADEARKRAE